MGASQSVGGGKLWESDLRCVGRQGDCRWAHLQSQAWFGFLGGLNLVPCGGLSHWQRFWDLKFLWSLLETHPFKATIK